jgi:hypothetical protein
LEARSRRHGNFFFRSSGSAANVGEELEFKDVINRLG